VAIKVQNASQAQKGSVRAFSNLLMNLNLKIAVASALDKSGVISVVRKYRSTRRGIILSLHRVLPAREAEHSFEPKFTLTDSIFEELLILLQGEFRIVSLEEILGQPEDSDHRQRVAITIDGGWADTYSYAYPLLLRYRLPAAVFLCPGLMLEGQVLPEERFVRVWQWCAKRQYTHLLLRDLRKWGLNGGESLVRETWSRLLKGLALNAKLLMLSHLENTYSVPESRERRFLTWEEVKIMRRNKISFGSHTMHHCTLTAEHNPALGEELKQSRDTIEFRLQDEVRYLAYPNGAYDRRVMEAARLAGYMHCFTTDQGGFRRKANSFAIPRINIDDSVVVNRLSSLHASRVRLHLQQYVGQHF
jgi:peptidoglycan/xylan/chitin deacetylase (PgdA/CDA1 family)